MQLDKVLNLGLVSWAFGVSDAVLNRWVVFFSLTVMFLPTASCLGQAWCGRAILQKGGLTML